MDLLKELIFCHATPGDEREVAEVLKREWQSCGWPVEALGHYAILAKSPQWQADRPTVMFCAHMDAPGFILQSVGNVFTGGAIAVTLGYPHKEEDKAVAVAIKTANGIVGGTIDDADDDWHVDCCERVSRGDRLCFKPRFAVDNEQMLIQATALDNRVGCWQLARLPRLLQEQTQAVNVIVAATAQEEMTGFGADVLAANVTADLTICLDATYTSEEQEVRLGDGPVLTVSDKSTLQSPEVCRALEELCKSWEVRLQEEIYNYSGTDAKAFPEAGATQLVLAILVPSEGNHTPLEMASLKDLRMLETLLLKLCTDASGVAKLQQAWSF